MLHQVPCRCCTSSIHLTIKGERDFVPVHSAEASKESQGDNGLQESDI